MAAKSDFTETEWEALRDAPHLVALSVAIAGGSGIIGSLKEAMAPAMALVEAAKEGGFLGFGGERFSENERAILAELSGVLETAQS